MELCGVEWEVGAYKQIILIYLQFGKLYRNTCKIDMLNVNSGFLTPRQCAYDKYEDGDCDDDDLMGK